MCDFSYNNKITILRHIIDGHFSKVKIIVRMFITKDIKCYYFDISVFLWKNLQKKSGDSEINCRILGLVRQKYILFLDLRKTCEPYIFL